MSKSLNHNIMGKIIGVLNQKGGVGKSILVSHISMALYHFYNPQKKSNFVCVYDSDNPQYTMFSTRQQEIEMLNDFTDAGNSFYENKLSSIYSEQFNPMQIFSGSIKEAKEKIEVLRNNFDYSIIDVVGTVNTDEEYDEDFIKSFDLIIVPMSNEFEVLRSTISFVAEIVAPIAHISNMEYSIVLNNVDLKDSKDYLETRESFENNGYKFFKSIITKRKKYERLYLRYQGMRSTLFPHIDKDINNLVDEIIKKLE